MRESEGRRGCPHPCTRHQATRILTKVPKMVPKRQVRPGKENQAARILTRAPNMVLQHLHTLVRALAQHDQTAKTLIRAPNSVSRTLTHLVCTLPSHTKTPSRASILVQQAISHHGPHLGYLFQEADQAVQEDKDRPPTRVPRHKILATFDFFGGYFWERKIEGIKRNW